MTPSDVLNKIMEIIATILRTLPGVVIGLILIINPIPILNTVGKIYWHLGKYTALDKSEKTKKYFIVENPFWGRVFGSIILILTGISVFVVIGDYL